MDTNKTKATEAVVDFIVNADITEFEEDVILQGKRCLLDGIGVVLAGSTTIGTTILRKQVLAISGRKEATVFGGETIKAPSFLAALANGTAGHAMDFDDTQLPKSADRMYGLLTHPTVPPLVSSLALGERMSVSGSRFLEAFLTGFEVECKIAEAINPDHYKRGFHTSATIGTFGAAASAAKLMNLERRSVASAIGIASSLCGGIRVNFGTMTKPLHVGKAAENGIRAAELASRGFTGDDESLDGPWGFFQVFGGGGDSEKIVGQLGNLHSIIDPGVSVKPYPCGVLGHPSMDAMLKLVLDNDIRPEHIKAVELRAGSNILDPLRFKKAKTALEAKFCPAFMLASIAIRRKAGIREFTDEFVSSQAVLEMMDRVETILDPKIEEKGYDKIRSVVEVWLHDGRHLFQPSDENYFGGPDRPFTREELHQKFRECAELVLPVQSIQKAIELIESIESLESLGELIAVLSDAELTESIGRSALIGDANGDLL